MKLPRLKEVRELHGWSQAKLAEEADVSRDSISNYETGHREAWPATAKKLANALGVEIADLARPAPVEELAGAGKGSAPGEAGRSKAKRLEDLQTYEAYLWDIAQKYDTEAKSLLGAGGAEELTDENLDAAIALLFQTGWTFDGGYAFLEHDDVVQEAEKGAPAERRAVDRVNNALNAILDVNEEIYAVLEPRLESDEEESHVVTRIEEYRQRRAG